MPTAGPSRYPNPSTPFATPSRSTLTVLANTFEAHGNATLSPMPNNKRSPSKLKNPPANPVSAVASDHTVMPAASTDLAPKRSVSQPVAGMHNT